MAMQNSNLYAALRVEQDVNTAGIEKAYRQLAEMCNPDKGGDEAKFRECSFAYDVLSNSETRRVYDRCGALAPLSRAYPDLFLKYGYELVVIARKDAQAFTMCMGLCNMKDRVHTAIDKNRVNAHARRFSSQCRDRPATPWEVGRVRQTIIDVEMSGGTFGPQRMRVIEL
jgi:curved DNA-binding protein CbpA